MIMDDKYQNELFYQHFHCSRCNRSVTSTSPEVVNCLEKEFLDTLKFSVFKKSIVSDSLREHIRRNAGRYKSMSEFGRALKEN